LLAIVKMLHTLAVKWH